MKSEGSEPNTAIDWLERDRNLGEGLDHLGVQAVSVALYTRLLPGLTNMTDRARYYSVYPWFIHRFAQDQHRRGDRLMWRNWIRRLDFTYAAASMAADLSIKGVVGADYARRLLRDKEDDDLVDLRASSELDANSGKVPARDTYFQAVEGGFGQYYKGALELLGIVCRDNGARYPDQVLTTYAGRPLAMSVDTQMAFSDLRAMASDGQARVRELRRAGIAIEPGALDPAGIECDLLRRIMLATDDELCKGQATATRTWRRASLLLALRFASDAREVADDFAHEFRWACASCRLPDGSVWELPDPLAATRNAWAAYQFNDVLSFALESLHFVALRRMDEGEFTPDEVCTYIAELAVAEIPDGTETVKQPPLSGSVAEWRRLCTADERAIETEPWGAASTWRWTEALTEAVDADDDAAVAAWAARLLARLATEQAFFSTHPFEQFADGTELAIAREVHLATWYKRIAQGADQPAREFIKRLVLEWVLYRHLRVATRKLATQGLSTFKFRPEQGRLLRTVDATPMPTLTNPRLRQAHRCLVDIGYLKETHERTLLTTDGRQMLEGAL